MRSLRWALSLGVALFVSACGHQEVNQSRWIWIDAGLYEPEPDATRIVAVLDSAARVGATGVVVEVKVRTGEALIPSRAFPVAEDVVRHVPGKDVLQFLAREARSRGLRVAAGIHCFYGGNVRLKRGLVYPGPVEWCITRYTESGFVRDDENESLRWVRLSPVIDEVRRAELEFLSEVLARPEVEGTWLMGVEFPDIWADFGPSARTAFERWLGTEVRRWPEDIFRRDSSATDALVAGNWLRQWLFWRAEIVRDFVSAAQRVAQESGKWLGVVVGGWLPRSYQQGVNWARPDYPWDNRWLPGDYGATSIAGTGVRLGIGLFFPVVGEKEARRVYKGQEEDPGWLSVEGCSKRAIKAVPEEATAVAVLHLAHYRGDAERASQAVRATNAFPDLLVLEASVLEQEHMWQVLTR